MSRENMRTKTAAVGEAAVAMGSAHCESDVRRVRCGLILLAQQDGEFVGETRLGVDHGAIGEDGFRRSFLPQGPFGVKPGKIPQVPTQCATTRMGAVRVGGKFAGNFVSDRVIVVPELHDPSAVNAGQRRGCRPFPIGRENGFPHHQHLQARVMNLFEQGFGCRGPPQTDGSRG
jgi:hypothetical protein